MLKHLGVVQACCRLPRFRENAVRKMGGRSLMEWVIRRVTDALRLDGVIVVGCSSETCRELARLVPSDVPVLHTEGKDPLERICRALEKCPAESAVLVRGDNLFVDPVLIDRLVTAAEAQPDCDYASYCLRDGRPAVLSPVCVYAEWFRSRALHEANRLARDATDREHVTRFLYTNPHRFNLWLIPAPQEIDREDLRLTLDSEEDWDHALVIYEALGPEKLEWQRIVRLLDHQPAIRNRMATLNRTCARA